jgi:XRE family aerobic/anaerobic benzoate catabolism transcriptional regulator
MVMAIAEALNVPMVELLPMGGEQDLVVSQAAAQLRRLPPDRVREALAWLANPVQGARDKAQRIALVGLRGAGKTSLGKALAEHMHMPFFEVSKEIEKRYGGAISLLMEINGPAALQRYEAEVLEDILGANVRAVVAAPGAIVSAGSLYERLLAMSWTVWLEASPEDHMNRVVAQGDLRPMAGNRTAMNDLRSILAAREADYARADIRINTSAQDFGATLNVLAQAVASLI